MNTQPHEHKGRICEVNTGWVKRIQAMLAGMQARMRAGVPVWDLGVRVFHWSLVLAVTAAAVTGFFAQRSALDVHLIAGSAIAALLFYRLVWGLLGSRYARFSSFAFGPKAVLDHARELTGPRGKRHLGHNPLGGMMVFAVLTVLVLIVLTGVVVLGGLVKQGPAAAFTSFSAGVGLIGVHKLLSLLLVAMVAAHLGGVWFESRREHENLAEAMVTGAKHGPADPPSPVRPRTGLAVWLCMGGLVLGSGAVMALSAMPALGVPTVEMDKAYARECSACHMAYSPSLLPASSWTRLMAHLDQHFGEDASLAPDIATHLTNWLVANGAEHWDTLPAVRIRQSIDPAHPFQITASGFWKRMHRHIPAATFANKEVGSRGNCKACHMDAASGRFAPQSIEIPEDLQ